jgi:hypothetical protein
VNLFLWDFSGLFEFQSCIAISRYFLARDLAPDGFSNREDVNASRTSRVYFYARLYFQ